MTKNKSVKKKCEYDCHVLCQRVLGILPNKVASHFLRGDFVWQNAYLAKRSTKNGRKSDARGKNVTKSVTCRQALCYMGVTKM